MRVYLLLESEENYTFREFSTDFELDQRGSDHCGCIVNRVKCVLLNGSIENNSDNNKRVTKQSQAEKKTEKKKKKKKSR